MPLSRLIEASNRFADFQNRMAKAIRGDKS